MDRKTPLSPLLSKSSLQSEHVLSIEDGKGEPVGHWFEEERKLRLRPTASTSFPPIVAMPAWWHVLLYIVLAVAVVLVFTVFKDDLDDIGASSTEILKYGSIPVVSVVFTYFHIWLALWMTFYPLEFLGWCQIPGTNTGLGWQGIIPNKAEAMARKSVKLMTTKLINVKEVFSRIEPKQMAKELESVIFGLLGEIIDSVAREHAPTLWGMLPQTAKEELIAKAHEDSAVVVGKLMADMRDNIDDVFDLESMVVEALMRDKALLNNMFIQCGYNELCFIRNSGAWMGFIFGVFQMIVWIFYEAVWLLPVFGLVVGAITNWLALKLIFSPVEPIDLGCYVCHGLFLKRQKEVSAQYAALVAHKILNAQNILAYMLTGPTTERLIGMSHKHIQEACDSFAGVSPALIAVTIGDQRYNVIKRQVCDRFVSNMPHFVSRDDFKRMEKYTDEALDMENLLRVKMETLPSAEFERLLHPVFEEDEWKLIAVGGALGAVVGILQAYGLQS